MTETEAPKKKKLLSSFEWLMFIIAVGIIGYIMYDKNDGNFSIMEKTESIEIVDNPHASKARQKKRVYQNEAQDESVEAVLRELAEEFSNEKSSSTRSAKTNLSDQQQISAEEREYMEDLKSNEKISDKIRNATDWFNTLKSAHTTYQKLQSVFSEASGQAPDEIEKEGLESLWENAENAETIFSNLSKTFNISEEQSRDFARRGKQTLSDWAQFIEENQK